MNTKTKALTVSLKLLFILLSINNVFAHELWNTKNGTSWIIGTQNECLIVEYRRQIDFAPDKPELITETNKNFNWPLMTAEQKAACDALKQAATPIKIWKVAANRSYTTRPVREIQTWLKVDGVRAIIGSECGKEVKPYNSRYSYREIIINNKTYAVICE